MNGDGMNVYKILIWGAWIFGLTGWARILYGVPTYVRDIKRYGASTLEALKSQGVYIEWDTF